MKTMASILPWAMARRGDTLVPLKLVSAHHHHSLLQGAGGGARQPQKAKGCQITGLIRAVYVVFFQSLWLGAYKRSLGSEV